MAAPPLLHRGVEPARRDHSTEAGQLLTALLNAHVDARLPIYQELQPEDWAVLLAEAERQFGTPYGLWQDDPVGFVRDVLGETLWSKQREMLLALLNHRRIAVPAGFGVGKTHLAARAVAFWCVTAPVGVPLAITIATRMRQVQRQLWPHIRRLHARADLPGECDMTQWRIADTNGVMTDVAYGFTAPAGDESGMQGIHAAKILLVADEAGGLEQVIGRSTRNLLTGDATMLAIGNPASDDEQSWFESLCDAGFDPERPADTTIRIRALDSPAITGEDSGPCRECPPAVPTHPLAQHLVDQEWVDDAIRDYGPDDPYVIAKVHAQFPKGSSNRVIPSLWVQRAAQVPDPLVHDDWVRPCDLGITGETRSETVRMGSWVRLGVDVAADGGDEFVIARSVGDLMTIEHTSAGSDNANAVTVAGVVLRHILKAQALANALGSKLPVRVKVDGIGVGWAVTSTLKAWKSEGLHDAEIVAVIVSEKPDREPDAVAQRPLNKRAEMWLTTRSLLTPAGPGEPGGLRLGALDDRTLAQLSGPHLETNSGGFAYVEAKKHMKARGVRSPDRAESILLAAYEPQPPKRKGRILAI